MCGRFANQIEDLYEWDQILQGWPNGNETGYNIAPSMDIPVITQKDIQTMRWGLIPGWSNDLAAKFATFNARMESIAHKAAFQSAWHKGQTCLIPALGYFEWRQTPEHKQPYFVRTKSGAPLVFAGLYEPAHSDIPASCTIITQAADSAMAKLHSRIPVLMPLDTASSWLNGDTQQARNAIRPNLQVYAVSPQVNNVRNSGNDLIAAETG